MYANNQFKRLGDKLKQDYTYWAESAKVDVAMSLEGLLASRNIKNKEFAELAGVSGAYISKALRGDANFSIDSLAKFANALNKKVHIEFVEQDFQGSIMDLLIEVERQKNN